MNKKVLIILLSFTVVFTLTSCAGKENNTKEKNISIKEELQEIDNTISEPIDASTVENLSEAEKTAIEKTALKQIVTPVDAFKTYMKKFPNTKVYKIEFEKEKGKFIYEIEGFNENKEYEIKIDIKTGKIIEENTPDMLFGDPKSDRLKSFLKKVL